MLDNYIKIAVRTLLRHKVFSAISILGLAASMSVCLLVLLFVFDQKSYDSFHPHADDIYRVYSDYKRPYSDANKLNATTSIRLAPLLDKDAAIAEIARVYPFGVSAAHADRLLSLSGLYVDPAFFRIFGFELTEGDARTALDTPASIVLAAPAAARFFGSERALGQTLIIEGENFEVTGLLKEPPGPSYLRFEALLSFASLTPQKRGQAFFDDWVQTASKGYTFLRLHPGANSAQLASRLAKLIPEHFPDRHDAHLESLYLQPLTQINFGIEMGNQLSLAMPVYFAYFLATLAALVMLAAAFNYTSLSVARSLTRAREVGLRKAVGAYRSQVVRQFLGEAVLMALAALLVAALLLEPLVRVFNGLSFIYLPQNQIGLDPLDDYRIAFAFVCFAVLIGLVAGLYPAIYLSRYQPAKTLKGVAKQRGRLGLSLCKMLVVAQFAFSLFLIITSLFIYRQFEYMNQADYGFDYERVINVRLQDVSYDILRQKLQSHPSVERLSAVSILPLTNSKDDIWMSKVGAEKPQRGYELIIDYDFVPNLGLKLLLGRNFSPDHSLDRERSVLINRSAVELLGFATPRQALDQTITLEKKRQVHIVGIVDDFYNNSMMKGPDPLVLMLNPERLRYANIRVYPGQIDRVFTYIEKLWPQLGSVHHLDCQSYAERIQQGDARDFRDLSLIMGSITAVAITIAFLGLLGISIYTAETRIKEIGVRRVFGASVAQIVLALSREFLWLVAIAIVLAVPLAYFVNNVWLEEMAVRIDLSPWIFVSSTTALLALALLAIGSQAFRATNQDPAITLRQE